MDNFWGSNWQTTVKQQEQEISIFGRLLQLTDLKITIEADEKYYRVILRYSTHKLHSEKLNLESAFDLAFILRKIITG